MRVSSVGSVNNAANQKTNFKSVYIAINDKVDSKARAHLAAELPRLKEYEKTVREYTDPRGGAIGDTYVAAYTSGKAFVTVDGPGGPVTKKTNMKDEAPVGWYREMTLRMEAKYLYNKLDPDNVEWKGRYEAPEWVWVNYIGYKEPERTRLAEEERRNDLEEARKMEEGRRKYRKEEEEWLQSLHWSVRWYFKWTKGDGYHPIY